MLSFKDKCLLSKNMSTFIKINFYYQNWNKDKDLIFKLTVFNSFGMKKNDLNLINRIIW
jgi:hypothetical protein